jgi:hypothetical protein
MRNQTLVINRHYVASRLLTPETVTVLALFALLLFAGHSASAQTVSGSLSGVVVDAQGAVVPGVAVSVRNIATGNLRQVKTNNAGAYAVPALPAADYQIEAEAPGFALNRSNVRLAVGQDLIVELTLKVATTEANVLIESGGNTLQQESAELSGLIGRKQILDLPLNGRSYGQLALLEPGVVATTNRPAGIGRHGLEVNINGAGSRSNSFLLDGTSAVDAYNNGVGNAVGNFLGVDAVQEFRVLTNAYSAQYGGASGGIISIITKSGSNEFHGTGFEFLRNDNLDARNFFDPEEKPEFKRNQFGFAVGGPMIKDQTFFFGTGEWLRERLGRSVVTTVPSLSARQGPVNPAVVPFLDAFFPLPNGRDFGGGIAEYTFPFAQNTDETYWQGRIDHKLSETNTFFGRFTFDDAARVLPTNYPILVDAFSSRNQYLTLEDTHVITPTLVNTARFSLSRTRITESSDITTQLAPSLFFAPGATKLGALLIGGMRNFAGLSDSNAPQNVFSVSDDITFVTGDHSLQSGVLVLRQQLNLFQDRYSPGQYTFSSIQQFLAARPSQLTIDLKGGGGTTSYIRNTLLGTYIQDSYKVSRNLTLNFGLRVESSTVPKEKFGHSVSLPDPLNDSEMTVGPIYKKASVNWAPRAGIAWNLFGDGKTVVRSGFGIFYDNNPVPFWVSGGALTTNPPFHVTVILRNPIFPRHDLSGVTATGSLSLFPVAYDWKTPRRLQYNFAIERELWANAIFSAAYVGARGTNMLRSGDVNLAIPQILPDGQPFFAAGLPRRNPSFGSVDIKRADGQSWYNAMLLKFRSRIGSHFQMQGSYTFSRSIDNTSAPFQNEALGSISQVLNPSFPLLDRGLSDFHRKHNLVANFTWELPLGRGRSGISSAFLADWAMSGIVTAQSGNPFTPGVQGDWSRSLNRPGMDRPSLAPGFNASNIILGTPDQWFDPNAFVLPPRGTYGNLGRNVLIGPGLSTVDLSISKRLPIKAFGDGGKLQFQADFFNLLNHANFNMPARIVFSGTSATEAPLSTAGRISSTSTSPRQLQLGVRLSW